jgi:hypothetical protein
VVAVIAVPTVAVTVCVAGVMLGAADTGETPSGATTTPASATAPATNSRLTMDIRDDMRLLLGSGVMQIRHLAGDESALGLR